MSHRVNYYPPCGVTARIRPWERPCQIRPGRRSSSSRRRYHLRCSTKPAFFTAAQDHTHSSCRRGRIFVQPSGWTATSFFPVADRWQPSARDPATGHAAEYNLEFELLPLEERLRRVRVSGRSILDKGTAPVQVWIQLAARLQEPAAAIQHPGNRNFQLQRIFRRLVCQFPAGRRQHL